LVWRLDEYREAELSTGRVCTKFIEEVRRTMGLQVFMLVGYESNDGITVSR
jgi:hypothetical protein